jgi:cytochrome c oxidase subunit 4
MTTTDHSAPRGALRYVLAWAALLVLTAASYGISRLDLGAAGTAVALLIAGGKACIVLLFFMHLTETSASARVAAAVAVAFIVLLCLGIYADVGFR